jgi:hypothetical protein
LGVRDLVLHLPADVAELLIQRARQQQRWPVQSVKPSPQRRLRARAHAAQAARESRRILACPLPA